MPDGSAVLTSRESARAFALNDSAASVWELCDGRRDLAAIARSLAGRYRASADDAARTAGSAVERFRAIGALDSATRSRLRERSRARPQPRYDVLGFRVAVTSGSRAFLATLDRLNASLRAAGTAAPHATYEAARRNGRWSVRYEGRELPVGGGLVEAASYLEWHICGEAIERRRDLLHLHGAALATSAGALLIPGEAGVGKTTLALALTLRGMRLLADDVVFLRPSDWRPVPFPRSLHVHSDALRRLARLGLRFRRDARVGEYLCATAIRSWATSAGPRIRMLVLPRPSRDRTPTLQPLSHAEAALELRRCSSNLAGFRRPWPDLASSLLAGVRCFVLRSGPDVARAADLVHRAFAAARTSQVR